MRVSNGQITCLLGVVIHWQELVGLGISIWTTTSAIYVDVMGVGNIN